MVTLDRKGLAAYIPALLLLGSMIALGVQPPKAKHDSEYLAGVVEAIEAIPYRIGPWIGADMPPQEPAIELLRPNKLLQRRYVTVDGMSDFSLLFVHCSDARDMAGHYPPNCYVGLGWRIETTVATTFELDRQNVPCTVYTLSAVRNGEERRMTILNFFAVPSQVERLTGDMSGVNRAAASTGQSGLGAAQIQLIVTRIAPVDELTRLMTEIAPALSPAVNRVIAGADEWSIGATSQGSAPARPAPLGGGAS
ncbi:MAG: exosortase-associated EpsI family protein [Planctomycetota bacterium]|nr:exosortase-associated EpsI family protein [Planctomycetota bacterium]